MNEKSDRRRESVAPLIVGTAAMLMLGGCSTTQSIDVGHATAAARRGAYLNYSVAKSMFTIEIDAADGGGSTPAKTSTAAAPTSSPSPTPAHAVAPVAPDPAAPDQLAAALTAGSGGTTPTPAATPTPTPTPVPTPASTPTPTPAATNDAGAPTVPDTGICVALTAEYTAAQIVVGKNIGSYSTISTRLAMLQTGVPATKDTPKQLSTDLATFIAAVESPSYQQLMSTNAGNRPAGGSSDGIYGQLLAHCQPKLKVSVKQTIVPDTNHSFALKPETNVFYTDTLNFSVDVNGFLTNGAPSSTSQVTAIASEIAKDVGMMSLPSRPAMVPPRRPGVMPVKPGAAAVKKSGPSCSAPTGATRDELVSNLGKCDATKPADMAMAAAMASALLPQLPWPGALQNLPVTMLPRTVYAGLEDFGATGEVASGSTLAATDADLRDKLGLVLKMDCSVRNDATPADEDATPESAPADQVTKHVYDGLVVSASRSCRLRATQANASMVAETYFWAQDSRYLTILPTRRGFLVPRSVGYTFANGQPTGVTDSRPSEALALVSFPGQVIGSFFSGFTAAATNKSTRTGARTTDLTAQTNFLKVQTDYMTAQAALDKAKADAAAAAAAKQ